MVKKKIRETIEKNNLINSGEHIVIGLSGGPDSVCLFSVLKELSKDMGFSLYAAHVNHGFRPGDAEKDQEYVEQLCERNGVPCTSFVYDCNAIAQELGMTGEEAGRYVRYRAFRQVADNLIRSGILQEKVKIAVAQNADDQAETVLLRLMRGTGPDGLAGMAYSRMEQNICVIRPLLDTWRKEIEIYCSEKNLRPCIDKTNLQPVYTRNKIRLQLIPYLEENYNTNIMAALNRLSRIAGEDKEYLWSQADEAYEQIKIREGTVDQDGLRQLPTPIRHRVIMKAFRQLGLDQDISAAHLENADRILDASGESKETEFPDGFKMIVRYGEVVFYKSSSESLDNENTEQKRSLSKTQGRWRLSVRVEDAENSINNVDRTPFTAVFDYDKMMETLGVCGVERFIRFRTRMPGDYLNIPGGRKKLQNYFVDQKIPKELRDKVKFASMGSEVLWIMEQPELGIRRARFSPKYKLDETTKKRLILELIYEI